MIDGPEAFCAAFGVSRETSARLELFAALLRKWNARINLVGSSTIPILWQRHIADSAQLWALRPRAEGLWLDVGAGAGLPGLVIAAIAVEQAPDLRVGLVESDTRKGAFLLTAAAAMQVNASVTMQRAEALEPQGAAVVSARAFAPLPHLLALLEKHRAEHGIGLFLKGPSVHKELREAEKGWRFVCKLHPSVTQPESAIVEIGAIERA